MRSIIGLMTVLCLASGLIGAFAVNELSGEAGAAPPCPPKCETPSPTPTPPQQREDQITIFSEPAGSASIDPGWALLSGQGPILLGLDASDYPASAVFRFEGTWNGSPLGESCLRLFDRTADSAVTGGEVCTTLGSPVRARSAGFSLPASEHEYTVQGRCDGCGVPVTATRVIVEWME